MRLLSMDNGYDFFTRVPFVFSQIFRGLSGFEILHVCLCFQFVQYLFRLQLINIFNSNLE